MFVSALRQVHPAKQSCFGNLTATQIRCCSTVRPKKNDRPVSDQLIRNILGKRFPNICEHYERLKQGFMNLLNDGKQIYGIHRQLRSNPRIIKNLTLQELDLYYDCWNDIKGLIPIAVLAVLPLGNFVVLFLLYWKPFKFLSPHFWSDNQRKKYFLDTHMRRIVAYKPIIAHLKNELRHPKNCEHRLYDPWNNILRLLQRDKIPAVSEVLRCADLFKHREMYSLEKLSPTHVNDLLAVHNLRGPFFKMKKLQDRAKYLDYVDSKIRNSIGASNLSEMRLKKYCFQRGVNANEMSTNDMRKWLDEYLKFSTQVTGYNISLLLHAPVIFGSNHPSNRSISINS